MCTPFILNPVLLFFLIPLSFSLFFSGERDNLVILSLTKPAFLAFYDALILPPHPPPLSFSTSSSSSSSSISTRQKLSIHFSSDAVYYPTSLSAPVVLAAGRAWATWTLARVWIWASWVVGRGGAGRRGFPEAVVIEKKEEEVVESSSGGGDRGRRQVEETFVLRGGAGEIRRWKEGLGKEKASKPWQPLERYM